LVLPDIADVADKARKNLRLDRETPAGGTGTAIRDVTMSTPAAS